jgi:hypothetical protein
MPGSSTSQNKTPVAAKKPINPNTVKVTRPTDIGPLSSFVRPTAVSQKISQITKTSLSNLTSRIMPRSFSTDKIPPKEAASQASKQEVKALIDLTQSSQQMLEADEDQMLIDETIDLVGSEENVNRLANQDGTVVLSKENLTFNPQPNATFDLCRRDGTFIKSPSMTFNVTKAVGSVNCLLDAKEPAATPNAPNSSRRAVSKSRDSLNYITGNQTRVIRLRKSGEQNISSLSLPKSPEWGSEDMLNMSLNKTAVFNSTMMNNRLIDATPFRPGLNFSINNSINTPISTTKLLCLTPDDSKTLVGDAMEVDEQSDANAAVPAVATMRFNETPREEINPQKRFSFGLDITECTLDCSFELVDASVGSAGIQKSPMDKQGSFEVDESLGILTPDQMKEFLDSTATNHTNNLELPLIPGHKLSHQYRMDQTPSPEELPLDPVGVKTDMMDEILHGPQLPAPSSSSHQEVSQTESDPKTEMTKSATSKVSNSIITSITSITSLDTGYIGDGELSRPASRGADQSPTKAPRNIPIPAPNWNPAPPAAVHRRNDPMTDSDFFTESDADDVMLHQRENQRRAQVIDGQLYGPMLQGANVFIQDQRQAETDSAMESSGIFTDVENRGEDYLLNRLADNRENVPNPHDMSPDLSSDTISSSHTACSQKKLNTASSSPTQHISEHFVIDTSSSVCSAMDESGDNANLIGDVASLSLGSTKSSAGSEGRNEENASVSSSAITKKATSGKKLSGTGRKSHKNEANLGLKKHEMTSRSVGKLRMTAGKDSLASGTAAKKCLNGKWESVMNKIAENKSVKKKFDNVKSKVTCGVVKRTAPVKSPLSGELSAEAVEPSANPSAIATGPSTSKR